MEFFLGMAEKMLLSALIDADWLDSAASGAGGQLDFWDLDGEDAENPSREKLFTYFLDNLENGLREMNRSSKPINVWRNRISEQCKEAGTREEGSIPCPAPPGPVKPWR